MAGAPAATFFPPTRLPRTAIQRFEADNGLYLVSAIGHLIEITPLNDGDDPSLVDPEIQHLFPVFDPGEQIVEIQEIQPDEDVYDEGATLLFYTRSRKYAWLNFEELEGYIWGGGNRPLFNWKNIVDMHKIDGLGGFDLHNLAVNTVWLYNPHGDHLSFFGPISADIFGVLTENQQTIKMQVLDSAASYVQEQRRYMCSSDSHSSWAAYYTEGTDFVEQIYGKERRRFKFPKVEGERFDGWDLIMFFNDIYLLTLGRLYYFNGKSGEVRGLELPIKGSADDCPYHRMEAMHYKSLKEPFTNLFVVVDDMVIRYFVDRSKNTIDILHQYSPGIGRITAWDPWSGYFAGAKGVVRLDSQSRPKIAEIHRHLEMPLPEIRKEELAQVSGTHISGCRVRLYNGNLVQYGEHDFGFVPPPNLPSGPYVAFLGGQPALNRYVVLRSDGIVDYVEADIKQVADCWPTALVKPKEVVTVLPYDPALRYNASFFWGYSDPESIADYKAKLLCIVTDLRTCSIRVYGKEGRLLLDRSEQGRMGRWQNALPNTNSVRAQLSDILVVKAGFLLTNVTNRIVVVTNHYFLIERTTNTYKRYDIDTLVPFGRDRPICCPRIPRPGDEERNRTIVDFVVPNERQLLVLLQCGYVIYYNWGVVTPYHPHENGAHQRRWRSIPGIVQARAFRRSSRGTIQVFGFSERTRNDGKKILTPAVYDLEKNFNNMTTCQQDMSSIAELPKDYYDLHVVDSVGIYSLQIEHQANKKNNLLRIPATRLTHLQPPLINHKVEKMVAWPVDEYGFSLIAAIGPALTLLVYQPEFEKLTVVNEHYPRYPCVDVTFTGVKQKVNNEKSMRSHIKGYIILATEGDVEVLEFFLGGQPTGKIYATSRIIIETIDTPAPSHVSIEVGIVSRNIFNVGPRVCSIYAPLMLEFCQKGIFYVFYVARSPTNEHDYFIGKFVVDVTQSMAPLGYDHERVPCPGFFKPGQQFKLLLKRNPDNEPTLEVYCPIAANPTRFKFGVWDLKNDGFEFVKEVAAFEAIDDSGKLYSLRWQDTYYTIKTRLVDAMLQRASGVSEADGAPTYFFHKKDGEFGWLLAKKSNGNPNFFPDKCLTARAKHVKFEKWAPILRNHAILYNEDHLQIVRACSCLTKKKT